jgi:threonine dehydrogenase-like Zn-dependent dehydrogenase
MEHMKALIFDGNLKLVEQPRPECAPDDCLVQVLRAGICNTDLEITKGYFGFCGVLGHEFVGRVERSADRTLLGQRVVGEINVSCNRCEYCHKELGRHCPNRTVLGILNRDGAFRQYLTLPAQNLHVVPFSLSDDAAVFVEPLAAACEILDQLTISALHRVAVLGDGKLGLLIAMVLSHTGCDLTLIGKHPAKMERLRGYTVKSASLPSSTVQPKSFDIVVEATGSPQGLEMALGLIKPRGILVLKSTFHGQVALNSASIVVDEITIVGSRCGRFTPALQLLTEGKIDPTNLIDATFPLEGALEAFAMASRPGVLKVLLTP